MSVLRKKELVTIITPIPGFIPRQLAIDILHAHSEVITLNPLVISHKPTKAPRDAASDEYYSTWYEITERIQYVPGLGRMGSGKIAFNACFHDMPWGLQAHIYAPMSTDLRYKYRIGGNQPGIEPPEPLEMGLAALGAPADGLYLREDVEVKCSIAVMSFVKSQLKAASKLMVQRIIKKAELLDAGLLHAMIENGKLRTINPADRTLTTPASSPSPALDTKEPEQQHQQQQQQQKPQSSGSGSPPMRSDTPGSPPPVPYQVPRPQSLQSPYGYRPGSAGLAQQPIPGSPRMDLYSGFPGAYQQGFSAHPGHASYAGSAGTGLHQQQPQQMNPAMYYYQQQYAQQQLQMQQQFLQQQQQQQQQPFYPQPPLPMHSELQAFPSNPAAMPSAQFPAVEMPGDFYHAPNPAMAQQPQPLPNQQQPPQQPQQPQQSQQQQQSVQANRESGVLGKGQWSAPTGSQNDQGQPESRPGSAPSDKSGHRSPPDKSFTSELTTHRESPDENRLDALKKLDPSAAAPQGGLAQVRGR